MQYTSDEEARIFKSLRSKNTDIAQINSHRNFLNACSTAQVTPRGMRSKLPNAAGHSNRQLEAALSQIHDSASIDTMHAIIKHYNKLHLVLLSERDQICQHLQRICTAQRYHHLMGTLQRFHDNECSKLQIMKDKKLSNLLYSNNTNSKYWVAELGLTHQEKQTITNNEQLSDESIDAAVKLLCRQLPYIHIQSCLLSDTLLSYSPLETLHIHHNGANHYCISSSFGGKVNVFDSLNIRPTQQVMNQITALYSPDQSTPEVHQLIIDHTQEGDTDCGLFAIAYAFELADGNNPSQAVFDQSKMRDHLLHCFTSCSITPFPKTRIDLLCAPRTINLTAGIPSTDKWSTPKKAAPQHQQPTQSTPIDTSNRFSAFIDAETPINQRPASSASGSSDEYLLIDEYSIADECAISFLETDEMDLNLTQHLADQSTVPANQPSIFYTQHSTTATNQPSIPGQQHPAAPAKQPSMRNTDDILVSTNQPSTIRRIINNKPSAATSTTKPIDPAIIEVGPCSINSSH